MEPSNEVKAKVFAQYIGHTCQTNTRQAQGEGQPFKRLKGVLKEIDLGMATNFIGVLLENETDFSNHTNYSPDECKLIIRPLDKLTQEEADEINEKFLQLGGGRHLSKDEVWTILFGVFFLPRGGMDDNLLKQFEPKEFILLHQYLQHKGFDMPNYLLDGKTLEKAGLAVYE